MGHGAKRSAHAAGGHLRQSYAGLVALRKRTRVGSCGLYENPRQRMSVLRRKKAQAGFNDLATQYPELARQWDYTKNIPVLPADVTTGSHRLVWWKCEKGHSWRASVRSRVSGNGCPVCAGRQLLAGENDLATRFPELAQEWDRQKNGTLTPESAIPGSSRRVWWRCKAGHSWFASISSRAYRNSGCPVCTGKLVLPGFNDLASQNPVLAAQWDAERNGTLTPQQVTLTSNRKAWWICEKGHSFQAVIASRANGTGCPYCTNKKCSPDSTIWRPSSRASPPSGTRR